MGLFGSLDGFVRVELTSADISGMLNTISKMQVPVFDLKQIGDLTSEFTVSRRKLKRIKELVQRKGGKLVVLCNIGVFWQIWGLRLRPILIIGTAVLLTLAIYLPTLVLFVEVEGSEFIPARRILEAAQEAGIVFGASRRAVRSEKVKNELLSALPQLQWAGVNTYGCRAVISVRERAESKQGFEEFACSNIVASCDGVITELTVTDGSGVCSVGQAVQKGQLLICGYTDCGGVITVSHAKGEVFAQTLHEISVATPSESRIRMKKQATTTKYSLLIGKKRINFYKGSGISDGSCVKMVTQYYLTLPGAYSLPIGIMKETCISHETKISQINDPRLAVWLSASVKTLLSQRGVALTVTDAEENVRTERGMIILSGVYNCVEMIGRVQGEYMGDLHGKTD